MPGTSEAWMPRERWEALVRGENCPLCEKCRSAESVNEDMFLVVPELPYELIIGADFLQRWKIKLDPTTEELIIDERALEMVLV